MVKWMAAFGLVILLFWGFSMLGVHAGPPQVPVILLALLVAAIVMACLAYSFVYKRMKGGTRP